MSKERLQKILAQAGVASRRAAEEIIAQGRVSIDGQVATEPGMKADPAVQSIAVDGKPLAAPERLEYWLVNKPAGVVSTASDPQGRPTVLDLLPEEARGRLYPVGRLDQDSEGLMLLTNHGELAQRLTHPKYQIAKRYLVWVEGRPSGRSLEALRRGVDLGDGVTAAAQVGLKSAGKKSSKLSFMLMEGKKREIRRMCKAVGHPVLRLRRMGLGPLKLGALPPGAVRPLERHEINALKQATGLLKGCKAGGDGVRKSSRSRQRPRT